MSGWGTDEDAIYGALSGRSAEDIRDIRDAYSDLYSKDLDAELADELDSDELAKVKEMMPVLADESGLSSTRAREVAENRARVTADRLRSAMQGLGTEEDEIFGALVGRTPEEIGEIKRQYFDLTNGHYLEKDLQRRAVRRGPSPGAEPDRCRRGVRDDRVLRVRPGRPPEDPGVRADRPDAGRQGDRGARARVGPSGSTVEADFRSTSTRATAASSMRGSSSSCSRSSG